MSDIEKSGGIMAYRRRWDLCASFKYSVTISSCHNSATKQNYFKSSVACNTSIAHWLEFSGVSWTWLDFIPCFMLDPVLLHVFQFP